MSQIQHESNAVTSVMMREAAYKRMLMDKGMVVLGHDLDNFPASNPKKLACDHLSMGAAPILPSNPTSLTPMLRHMSAPPALSTIHPPSEAPQPPARAHTTPLIVVKEEPRETNLPLDASHVEYCQPMTKMTQRLLDSIMENAYIKFTIDTSERIPPNGSAGASRVAQRAARYEPYLAARRTKLYREQMARGRDAPPSCAC
ncbi:hypothetical protein ONZ51_g9662 [Trametes cubensis]|uniref:Uncharacterized protein n=1 Tax=Trametes cubensis TaxID=1111947 RepID=A0AAD7TKZ3_9APHY|nr:hypothetical protein ONZ51_g9662 [Trametes cubensis]